MTSSPEPETLLDDATALVARDAAGLLRATAQAGALIRLVSHEDVTVDGSAFPERTRSVVLCGHGEAASAGRFLRELAAQRVAAPAVLHDAIEPPDWLSVGDTVLALSRTGDDEHSLRTAELALRRGCSLFALAPEGSPLGVLAASSSAVWRALPANVVDGAALWAQLAFGLEVLDGVRAVEPHESLVRSSLLADRLDEISARNGPVVPTYDNPAKGLALELAGATPLLVSDSALATAVADRFALRLLHCTGVPAQVVPLPGGLASVRSALRGPLVRATRDIFYDPYADDAAPGVSRPLRVVLFSESADAAARHRLHEMCEEHAVSVSVVAAEGEETAHRLASMSQPADLAVVYLSLTSAADDAPDGVFP